MTAIYDQQGNYAGDDGQPSQDEMRLALNQKNPSLSDTLKFLTTKTPADTYPTLQQAKNVGKGLLSAGESAVRGIGSQIVGTPGDILDIGKQAMDFNKELLSKTPLADLSFFPASESVKQNLPETFMYKGKPLDTFMGIPYATSAQFRKDIPERMTPKFGDESSNEFMEQFGGALTPIALPKLAQIEKKALEEVSRIPSLTKEAKAQFVNDYVNAMNGVYRDANSLGARTADIAKGVKQGVSNVENATIGEMQRAKVRKAGQKAPSDESVYDPLRERVAEGYESGMPIMAVRHKGTGIVAMNERPIAEENQYGNFAERLGLNHFFKHEINNPKPYESNDQNYRNFLRHMAVTQKSIPREIYDDYDDNFGNHLKTKYPDIYDFDLPDRAYRYWRHDVAPEDKKVHHEDFINNNLVPDVKNKFNVKLPTLQEFNERGNAATNWLDTVARNYFKQDIGAVKKVGDKLVPADPILRAIAEGYTPLSDKDMSELVSNYLDMTKKDITEFRKKVGLDPKGYIHPETLENNKHIRNLNKEYDKLNTEEQGLLELANQENNRLTLAGQDTISPYQLQPRLSQIKKEKTKLDTELRDAHLKTVELGNAKNVELFIDAMLGARTDTAGYMKSRIQDRPDRNEYPTIMNMPQQYLQQTTVYNPRSSIVNKNGLFTRVFNDYINDVLMGKITIANGKPTLALDAWMTKHYDPARKENRRLRTEALNFEENLNKKLQKVIQDAPNTSKDGENRPLVFGNHKVIETDWRDSPNDIRERLSEGTECLDHCIGQGGHGNSENHWRYKQQRSYKPAYHVLSGKPLKETSHPDTSYMGYAMGGKEFYSEIRNAKTGMPELTLQFQNENYNSDDTKDAIRSYINANADRFPQKLQDLFNGNGYMHQMMYELEKKFPDYYNEIKNVENEYIKSLPQKYNVSYANGWQNGTKNVTPEISNATAQYLNTVADKITRTGGYVRSAGIFDKERESADSIKHELIDRFGIDKDLVDEKFDEVDLPRFLTKDIAEQAFKSVPEMTADKMTQQYNLYNTLQKSKDASSDITKDFYQQAMNMSIAHGTEEAIFDTLVNLKNKIINSDDINNHEFLNKLDKVINKLSKQYDLNKQYRQLHGIPKSEPMTGLEYYSTHPTDALRIIGKSHQTSRNIDIEDIVNMGGYYATPQEVANNIRKYIHDAGVYSFNKHLLENYADFFEGLPNKVVVPPPLNLTLYQNSQIKNLLKNVYDNAPMRTFRAIDSLNQQGLTPAMNLEAYVKNLEKVKAEQISGGYEDVAQHTQAVIDELQRIVGNKADSAGHALTTKEKLQSMLFDPNIYNSRLVNKLLHAIKTSESRYDSPEEIAKALLNDKSSTSSFPEQSQYIYAANELLNKSRLIKQPEDLFSEYANALGGNGFFHIRDAILTSPALLDNPQAWYGDYAKAIRQVIPQLEQMQPAPRKDILAIAQKSFEDADAQAFYNQSIKNNGRFDNQKDRNGVPQIDMSNVNSRTEHINKIIDHALHVMRNHNTSKLNLMPYGEHFLERTNSLGLGDHPQNLTVEETNHIRNVLNEMYEHDINPQGHAKHDSEPFQNAIENINNLMSRGELSFNDIDTSRQIIRQSDTFTPSEKLELERHLNREVNLRQINNPDSISQPEQTTTQPVAQQNIPQAPQGRHEFSNMTPRDFVLTMFPHANNIRVEREFANQIIHYLAPVINSIEQMDANAVESALETLENNPNEDDMPSWFRALTPNQRDLLKEYVQQKLLARRRNLNPPTYKKGGQVRRFSEGGSAKALEDFISALTGSKSAEAITLPKLQIMQRVAKTIPEMQAEIRMLKEKGAIADSRNPQTPSFVMSDVKNKKNPAGYTRPQFDRNQQYKHKIQEYHQFGPTDIIKPENIEGHPLVMISGDRTRAGADIVDVNGVPLTSPSRQYAGPNYGKLRAEKGVSEFWASGEDPAELTQDKVRMATEQTGQMPIGIFSAMGAETGNYSLHNTDVALKMLYAKNPNKSQMDAFSEKIKEGYKKDKNTKITFPDFVGLEDIDALREQLHSNPKLRKFFINQLEKSTISQPLDLPEGLAIRNAITEPDLVDVPIGNTGYSVGLMRPDLSVTKNFSHPTYSHSIPGNYLGRMELQLPWNYYFPENAKNIARNPKQMDSAYGTMQKLKTYETVTPQMVDELSKMYELFSKGNYKKGGKVEKFDNGGQAKESLSDKTNTQLKEEVGESDEYYSPFDLKVFHPPYEPSMGMPIDTTIAQINRKHRIGDSNLSLGGTGVSVQTPLGRMNKLADLNVKYEHPSGLSASIRKPIGGRDPMFNVEYKKEFKKGGKAKPSIAEMRLALKRKVTHA